MKVFASEGNLLSGELAEGLGDGNAHRLAELGHWLGGPLGDGGANSVA